MRKKEILKGNDKMYGDEFKQKFYDKIAWVNLLFTWEDEKYSETNYKVEFKDGRIEDVVIGWNLVRRDPEYSFNGSPEDAIKFMDEYNLWDDLEETDIHDMVLEKKECGFSDDSNSWLEELTPSDMDGCLSLESIGLCYIVQDRGINRLRYVWAFDDVKRIFKAKE